MPAVTITLKTKKVCKHSVRFDATNDEDAHKLRSIYIGNDALLELGYPKSVKVTVESAD